MPLIIVKRQNWYADFAYAPPLEECAINTEEVVSAVPTRSRGAGPFMTVTLRNGDSMIVQGVPGDLVRKEKP